MKNFLLLLAFCLLVRADEFKIKVGVSLAPYAYFVQKIGGKHVDVLTLIPYQRNPKFYELKYTQVKQIKDLRLLIVAGANYEKKWLSRFEATNPSLRILNVASKECQQGLLCYEWLSLNQVRQIAKKIAHQLRVIDLKNAKKYKKNLANFLLEIDAFEEGLKKQITLPMNQRQVIEVHPIWKTLAQELGLEYVLLQEKKQFQGKYCLITPFDVKKQVSAKYHIPLSSLREINPFREDWKPMLLEFVDIVISGGKSGK